MAGASANRYDLRRVKEASWGATPANPALILTRNTGESLSKDISTETSKEIRSDRSPSDTIPVDASIAGGFEFEMSYGTYDDLIASALMSDWQDTSFTGDISTTTASTDNLSSTTPNAFQYVAVGQSILLVDFTTPTNNRVYKVTGKTSDTVITLYPAPAAAETVPTAKAVGAWIKNGTTEQSYSLVKRYNDLSPAVTQLFSGMRVKGFSWDMSTASLITGTFDFIGAGAEWGGPTAVTGETTVPASTTTVMNAVTNITDISVDGVGLCATGSVSNMTFNLDNQHREQKGLCRFGNVGVVAGQLQIRVSGSQYFTNSVDAQKFEDSTAFSFAFALEDPEGNAYYISLPRCKYNSYSVNATGLDTDVMSEVEMLALADPVTNATVIITRIPFTAPTAT